MRDTTTILVNRRKLGVGIYNYLRDVNISQSDFAKTIGMTKAHLSMIINCRVRRVRYVTLNKILKYLDYTIDDIKQQRKFDNDYGNLLRLYRQRNTKTLKEVAEKIGITAQSLSQTERGKNRPYTLKRTNQICKILKLNKSQTLELLRVCAEGRKNF